MNEPSLFTLQEWRLPILLETLIAVQMQLKQFSPYPQKVTTVEAEEFVTKPLVVETKVTKEETPQVSRNLTRKAIYLPPQGGVEQLYADNTNNCVLYAKSQTGIYRTMGNGGRAAVQGTEPKVGAIGVLKGTPHAVVVESVGEMITFRESNFRKGWITRRTLPISSFIGFIYN